MSNFLQIMGVEEFKIQTSEFDEIFNLISYDGVFFYAEYMIEIEARTRSLFNKITIEESGRYAESSMTLDKSHSFDIGQVSIEQH